MKKKIIQIRFKVDLKRDKKKLNLGVRDIFNDFCELPCDIKVCTWYIFVKKIVNNIKLIHFLITWTTNIVDLWYFNTCVFFNKFGCLTVNRSPYYAIVLQYIILQVLTEN